MAHLHKVSLGTRNYNLAGYCRHHEFNSNTSSVAPCKLHSSSQQLCAPASTLQKTCLIASYNKMILFLLANVAMHIPIGSSQHDYFPCHLPLGNIYGLPLYLLSRFHVARCFFPSHPNIFLHIPGWLQLFFSHLFVPYLKSFLVFHCNFLSNFSSPLRTQFSIPQCRTPIRNNS